MDTNETINTSVDSSNESQASEAVDNDTTQVAEGQEEVSVSAESSDVDQKEALEAKEEAGEKLTKTEKKTLRKLQLKIDGKLVDETLPFELEDKPEVVEYMKKQLQLAKVAQKRGGEYSALQKDVAAFFEALRKDPAAVLSDPELGLDIKQLAAKVIQDEIENSKKTPEQIEREKLESELKRLKDERESEKKAAEEEKFQRMQEQAYIEYDRQVDEALQSSSLPKNPYIIKKMADYMMIGLNEGLNITAKDVLPLVEEEVRNDIKELFAVAPEDVIESLVGKDILKKMRKKNVDKAKEAKVISEAKNIQDTGNKKKEEPKPVQKVNYKNFFGV
jgi:hypothetical protein